MAPGGIDFCVVRENNEGEYSNIGGRIYSGTDDELAMQQSDVHAARLRPDDALSRLSWRKRASST